MTEIRTRLNAVLNNIDTVIVGKRRAAQKLLACLLCRGHALIEDVPGVGKTSMVSAMARSVGCTFGRIQFTPDILPSDITGFSMYNPKSGQFEYRQGLVMRSFVLADEINRTSPKTQASLLEVMEEGQVTVDGVTYPLSQPFMVMATQNPVEYVGTYPLPEAQMDRFLMRITLGYPTPQEESDMLLRFWKDDPLKNLTPVVSAQEIVTLQEATRRIYVAESLRQYMVSLCKYTRLHPQVELGVSPRGTLSLFRAAQAQALLDGRTYVLPDDVKDMAPPVLSHRIILRQEARLSGTTDERVVEEALRAVPPPKGSAHEG